MRHNWEYKKFGDVLTIINGKNQKNVECDNGKYPIYGSGGIMGYANDYLCPENTTIIGRKGSINNPLFITTKFWNVDTAFGLVSNSALLTPRYLYYFCRDYNFLRLNKAVTIPSLTKSDLLQIEMGLPPLPTQQAIVSELDTLSGIIAECKETLKDYDALEQSIFYDMFGDPVKNEKGWEMKKLGECFKVTSSKRIYMEELTDCGIPFLKVADINNLINEKCTPTSFISNDKYQELKSNGHVPSPNDLLVTARGTIGKVYIIQENDAFYFQDGMITWLKQGRYKIEPKYIKDLFQVPNFLEYLGQFSNNSTVAFLSIAKLATVNIPIPPLPLQQSFATKIEAIEQMKAETKEALKEAETLFEARMDYWFG